MYPSLSQRLALFCLSCLALAGISSCTFGQTPDMRYPDTRNVRQRGALVRFLNLFLSDAGAGASDKRNLASELPNGPKQIVLPSDFPFDKIDLYFRWHHRDFSLGPKEINRSVPADACTVAVLTAPIPSSLKEKLRIVGGFDLSTCADLEEAIKQIVSLRPTCLVLRDVVVTSATADSINKLTSLQTLILYGVSSQSIGKIALKNLKTIDFRAVVFGPALGEFLRQQKQLEEVSLFDCELSAPVLSALSSLKELCHLNLSGTGVDDDELSGLLKHLDLQYLGVRATAITDAAMSAIGSQHRLQGLNVSRCGISDNSMSILARLPNLDSLDLRNTAVTDRGLDTLSKSKSLKVLWLQVTEVTPAGISALARMPLLKDAWLPESFDEAAMEKIRRLRPKVRFHRD